MVDVVVSEDHLVRTVKLFNKNVEIRNYGCGNKLSHPEIINPPRLNLYIQLNSACNGSCNFCEYYKEQSHKFNIEKLKFIIEELNKNINIGKLNITGGEPTLNLDLLDNVINCLINEIDINNIPELILNTNGYNLLELLKYDLFFSSIALSYHHYDDEKNFEIFNSKNVSNSKDILNFQLNTKNPNVLKLRCNLINGYIDCFDEVKKYLDHMITLNCYDCGFVTLMPLNKYCTTHQIDFAHLIDINDDCFLKVNYWNRYDKQLKNIVCNCGNYVYVNEDGKTCKFYSRLFCHSDLKEGQLVYDGQFLREGFGGRIIF